MDLFSSLSSTVLLIGIILFLALCIVLPISAYSAQKYAYFCYQELKKLNANLTSQRSVGTSRSPGSSA